jgi:sec-independent protein translocase protein TatC
MAYGGDVDKPMITIDEYMSFFVITSLAFGASFELPLVLVTLGMLEIIDQKFLRTKRRYAYLGLAVVAAVITPPDLLSMLMMLVPMLVLYEISVFFVGFFERRKQLQQDPAPL